MNEHSKPLLSKERSCLFWQVSTDVLFLTDVLPKRVYL